MSISIMDVVKDCVGEKDEYTGEDFEKADRPMISGCQQCNAVVGPWNAFPTKTGFVMCGECVGDDVSFESVTELLAWEKEGR